ncbi:hypothetical protein CPT_Machias_062 [Staphylococcus phage Machias]|nr:hypothetical protein CPT_Machias_062 [Staphylococcus phage Machias]WPH64113.1 hypothetical protein [Staphylococcus phage vB_StaM_PB50]
MITNTEVLNYIERDTGFLFNELELNPDEIIKTVERFTIPTFSKFHPKQERIIVKPEDKVEGTQNVYYIDSPNPIVNINRVIGANNNISNLTGYAGSMSPYAGFMMGSPIDSQMMADLMAINLNPSTFRYLHPNKIEIMNGSVMSTTNLLIIANTYHDKHFGSIPNNMHDYFLELASYDVQMSLYSMRGRFQNLQTTFGELNLNMDDLRDAREKRRELVEKMENNSIYNSNRKKLFFG